MFVLVLTLLNLLSQEQAITTNVWTVLYFTVQHNQLFWKFGETRNDKTGLSHMYVKNILTQKYYIFSIITTVFNVYYIDFTSFIWYTVLLLHVTDKERVGKCNIEMLIRQYCLFGLVSMTYGCLPKNV